MHKGLVDLVYCSKKIIFIYGLVKLSLKTMASANQTILCHRIIEWLRLAGTSEGHLVQPSSSSRVTQSWLLRTVPRWLLSISHVGDSTTSLGNLCQESVTITAKKVFPGVHGEPPVFFVPTGTSPVTGHQAELRSAAFAPSLQILIHMDKVPLSLLFFRLSRPSPLSPLCRSYAPVL